MSSPHTPLLQQWRDADAAAHAAEQRVFDAAMAYMQGTGPAPAEEEWSESKRLRARANELFGVAMQHATAQPREQSRWRGAPGQAADRSS